MSNPNDQWKRHSADEAAARAKQQASAGASHKPVEGPPPYGNEEVNLLAAEIVRAERERCAQLVEGWPADDARAAALLRELAERIRRSG